MLVESHNWIDLTLQIWFSLTAVSVIYVAWDDHAHTEMKVMKWGWVLVTLYAGPLAFIAESASEQQYRVGAAMKGTGIGISKGQGTAWNPA